MFILFCLLSSQDVSVEYEFIRTMEDIMRKKPNFKIKHGPVMRAGNARDDLSKPAIDQDIINKEPVIILKVHIMFCHVCFLFCLKSWCNLNVNSTRLMPWWRTWRKGTAFLIISSLWTDPQMLQSAPHQCTETDEASSLVFTDLHVYLTWHSCLALPILLSALLTYAEISSHRVLFLLLASIRMLIMSDQPSVCPSDTVVLVFWYVLLLTETSQCPGRKKKVFCWCTIAVFYTYSSKDIFLQISTTTKRHILTQMIGSKGDCTRITVQLTGPVNHKWPRPCPTSPLVLPVRGSTWLMWQGLLRSPRQWSVPRIMHLFWFINFTLGL